MRKNILEEKSKLFAIKIYNLAKNLDKKGEVIISRQILRSGTSIGANIFESSYAASKLDFINKLQISLKEANETNYWIELLFDLKIISEIDYKEFVSKCQEIIKILSSSILTAKKSTI